jgi:1-phosphofructokinase
LRAVGSETPNGTYVHDRRSGKRDVIVETPAPPLSRHDLDALYGAVLVAGMDAGTCVLTSTVPPVLPSDTFRRLTVDLASNDVHVVADLSGEDLNAVLVGRIELMKVSHEELCRDGFAPSEQRGDVIVGMSRLRAAGARDIVVSRAGDSTLALFGEQLLEATFPTVEVIDARGAGDSMTAALAVARARGLGPKESLQLAVAAGTLNVTRHGLATGQQEDIERLSGGVDVEDVSSELAGAAPS